MKVLDVMIGLICAGSGGVWVLVSVQIFKYEADPRESYIATFFGLVFVVLAGVLLWRRLEYRLNRLGEEVRRLEDRK